MLRAHAQTPPTALFCEVQRCASGSQSGFVFHPHSDSDCCCYLSVWRSRASSLFDSRPTDQWMPVVKTSHFSCAGRIITPSLAEVTSPLLFASLASPSANCWEEEGRSETVEVMRKGRNKFCPDIVVVASPALQTTSDDAYPRSAVERGFGTHLS